VDAVVELGGVLSGSAREIGPAHRPDEKGVPGEDEPGIAAAPQVCDHEADALRRVAGGMEHRAARVAEHDLLSIAKRFEGQSNVGRFV
jgi:hypothetical protein